MKHFTDYSQPTRLEKRQQDFHSGPLVWKLLAGAAFSFIVAAPLSLSADPSVTASVRELVSDYSWGFRSGLKQPQGSYKDGRSVYSVSRRTVYSSDPNKTLGSPDSLVWVDERQGTQMALIDPKGFNEEGVNVGGNVVFTSGSSRANKGEMWWVTGGRAYQLPFDLSRSLELFNPRRFEIVLDDFETARSSTAPTLSVAGKEGLEKGLVVYRYLSSPDPNGAVLFQRYDLGSTVPDLEDEGVIGRASPATGFGTVTIEQVWSRWDPRKGAVAATWQWFWRIKSHGGLVKRMGSNPFVFTEDFGKTWKLADGSVVNKPLTYATQTNTTTPYDHLSRKETTSWFTRDVGFGVKGAPWIALPVGNATAAREIRFFFWSGSRWDSRPLTVDLDSGDPVACGATRDYMVCAFSERGKAGALLVRVSSDDGRTWSKPVQVDNVRTSHGGSNRINFVSFVQPADNYADNAARFFYGYYKQADGNLGIEFENNIRWAKINIR